MEYKNTINGKSKKAIMSLEARPLKEKLEVRRKAKPIKETFESIGEGTKGKGY